LEKKPDWKSGLDLVTAEAKAFPWESETASL